MAADAFGTVGILTTLAFPGIPQPEIPKPGTGTIYYDEGSNTWMIAANGGPYGPLGGAGVLPPLTGVLYAALMENPIGVVSWTKITQDMIDAAFSDSIALFGGSATVEIGSSVVSPQFNATYNRTPTLATLTDSDANPPQVVTVTPNPITRPFGYSKVVNNDSVTFTLTADEGGPPAVATTSIAWRPLAFWGTGLPGGATEAFIEALANNALASGRGRTFTVTAGAPDKIYYAYPLSYGAGTFSVNGFVGGFLPPTTVSVTNAFGVTQNYLLYESALTGLGSTTVVVS